MTPDDLTTLLVCPRCRGDLQHTSRGLVCRTDGLLFPVVDGVPWMVEERAKRWTERDEAS